MALLDVKDLCIEFGSAASPLGSVAA